MHEHDDRQPRVEPAGDEQDLQTGKKSDLRHDEGYIDQASHLAALSIGETHVAFEKRDGEDKCDERGAGRDHERIDEGIDELVPVPLPDERW